MKLEEVLKTEKFESMSHKAMLNIMYTAYWARTKVSAALKQNDFTVEQFNVMRILKGKHPQAMCIKNIASRMVEANSNVPRIIDRLIAKGTARRTQSAEDRRETLVSITQKGLKQLELASAAVSGFNKTVNMSEEDATQLNNLLEQLRTND